MSKPATPKLDAFFAKHGLRNVDKIMIDGKAELMSGKPPYFYEYDMKKGEGVVKIDNGEPAVQSNPQMALAKLEKLLAGEKGDVSISRIRVVENGAMKTIDLSPNASLAPAVDASKRSLNLTGRGEHNTEIGSKS